MCVTHWGSPLDVSATGGEKGQKSLGTGGAWEAVSLERDREFRQRFGRHKEISREHFVSLA